MALWVPSYRSELAPCVQQPLKDLGVLLFPRYNYCVNDHKSCWERLEELPLYTHAKVCSFIGPGFWV